MVSENNTDTVGADHGQVLGAGARTTRNTKGFKVMHLCVLTGDIIVLAAEIESTTRNFAEEAPPVCCTERQKFLLAETALARPMGDISLPEFSFEGGRFVHSGSEGETLATS